MKFRATVDVVPILASALIGALVIVLGNWIFGDLHRDDFTAAVAFVIGDASCLWVLYGRRDR